MLNYTKHEVNIINKETGLKTTIPSSGFARVETISKAVSIEPTTGVEVVCNTYSDIIDMPTFEEAKAAGGVIVSLVVLNQLDSKWHCVAFAPETSNNVIRDEKGQVAGVTALVTVPK